MKLEAAKISGAFIVTPEKQTDDRGFFARVWCREEFRALGLAAELDQCNISRSTRRGTVRGLHFQHQPHEEIKLVRCTQGAVYDVIVDLRPLSPTYTHWMGVTLDSHDDRALYVPAGCAHGFQSLVDGAVVCYQNSGAYDSQYADGVRWDDPAFGIVLPLDAVLVSSNDRNHELFAERLHLPDIPAAGRRRIANA